MFVKKLQKLIEKHVREHIRTQLTARKTKSFNDNFCKKNNSIKIPMKDKVQKKVRSHNDRYAYKSTCITHQKYTETFYNIKSFQN